MWVLVDKGVPVHLRACHIAIQISLSRKVITAVFLKDTLDAANNDAEFLVMGIEGCPPPKGNFSKKHGLGKEVVQFEFVNSCSLPRSSSIWSEFFRIFGNLLVQSSNKSTHQSLGGIFHFTPAAQEPNANMP